MSPESDVDPRADAAEPDDSEIEAWAARERRRRQAWLAGPSQAERDDWARSYRRRAALGLEESVLGPLDEEVDAWAEREHRRRAAWAAGPSEHDKQRWARGWRRRLHSADGSSLPPLEEDIEAWAAREHKRRVAWLAGPSSEEKRRWARDQEEPIGPWSGSTTTGSALPDGIAGWFEDMEYAARGSAIALARGPLALWSNLVRMGRTSEDERQRRPRRGRVPY